MRFPSLLPSAAGALLLLDSCDGTPLSRSEISTSLSLSVESEHYTFHHAPGDAVDPQWQEAYHTWAATELGISPPEIHYYKYFNRSHMHDLTGMQGNAWADRASFSVHTIWPTDNHEVVHLYSSLFGSAPALFSEGFAVAHQVDPRAGDFDPKWSSVPLHSWARRFRREGRLIPIADLLETSDFRRFDDAVTYPEAGSFVRHLIDTAGLEKMLGLFRNGSAEQRGSEVRSTFLSIYGFTIEDAEESWAAFLDHGSP